MRVLLQNLRDMLEAEKAAKAGKKKGKKKGAKKKGAKVGARSIAWVLQVDFLALLRTSAACGSACSVVHVVVPLQRGMCSLCGHDFVHQAAPQEHAQSR